MRITFATMNFPAKVPKFVTWFYPSLIWRVPTKSKTVFLTFDDGPTPEITEWVLAKLKEYNFKASFFLIGNNAEKHPEIAVKIVADGHVIGNHTYNHLRGWGTNTPTYVADTKRAAPFTSTKLFRPPYGRITQSQISALKKSYKIVMWDIISYDFDDQIGPEQCAQNVIKNLEPGSIIVFHDSQKAWANLQVALPQVLLHLQQNGFTSQRIPEDF